MAGGQIAARGKGRAGGGGAWHDARGAETSQRLAEPAAVCRRSAASRGSESRRERSAVARSSGDAYLPAESDPGREGERAIEEIRAGGAPRHDPAARPEGGAEIGRAEREQTAASRQE